jgi:1-acyl-sn-glycerol-3-phosphate acyltransferase
MTRMRQVFALFASRPALQWLFRSIDLLVTILLWLYFTLGFVALAGPFYLFGAIFARDRHTFFQTVNHYFYRGFFLLCRLLAPMHAWHVDPAVHALRASVIVCNHISYLDSILLIALFPRHTTIVKNRLFQIPILGWVLTLSGYLPASVQGRVADLMVARLGAIPDHLAAGGNLFVFPEGTRSRDGNIGPFNNGAFKIAKYCRAPMAVLFVRHTDKLFRPGRFLFNTSEANTITLELLDTITPCYDGEGFSLSDLMRQVRALMEMHAGQPDAGARSGGEKKRAGAQG